MGMGGQGGGGAGAVGGAGEGGAAGGGGGQGRDAVPLLDLRQKFKCLTCNMKECQQSEDWIRKHKEVCRGLQKGRQQEQHKVSNKGKGKAPGQPKTKKGSAPPQPKPKGSGAKKAANKPKAKKR